MWEPTYGHMGKSMKKHIEMGFCWVYCNSKDQNIYIYLSIYIYIYSANGTEASTNRIKRNGMNCVS